MSEPSDRVPTGSPLPPPPPPVPQIPPRTPRPPRAGDLTTGWRIVTGVCWVGVALALAAVWNTSVQLGLSTWWLGPRADRNPIPVRLLPFAAPLLMLLGVVNHVRWLAWCGLGASGVLAVVGAIDLGRVTGLGVLELAIAAAAAAVSIASLAGTYRPVEDPTDEAAAEPSGEAPPASG